ncbi:PAS domain S-box protein [Pedobacter arcticus]|uniref:PAS domain S-box protein n=1 Tax=Pedobacter arcticus TaxID=752140 RepID=UPI0002D528F7|nr:PAS domain S-box protein [Pedobacter arcticus]
MINHNENERVDALKNYQILDTLPKESFDRFTKLASIICEVPISLISLLDENRQWFKSKVGIDASETPKNIAFCRYTILNNEIFEVEDATEDDRFKENPLVTSSPHIKFYAGYPLIDPQGYALGTLCVIDTKPRKLKPYQREALKLLTRSIIELIVLQRKTQEVDNFDRLFKISRDLICILEPNGQFVNANPAFKHLLGWNQTYLKDKSFFDFVHPDDITETKEKINKLITGVPTVSFSHRFKNKEGLYRMLEWAATPEPSTKMFFAIARDVTDAKAKEIALHVSEQKLRAFFENSTAFMCTHDLDGRLLTVNGAGAKSLGYSKEEIVGSTLFQLIPKSRYEPMKAYLAAIEKFGEAKGLMYTQHKNGDTLTWLFNNVLETAPNGDKYVIGNAVDITERYKLEADLTRTKEMLEQTNGIAKIGAWEIDLRTQKIYWSSITKVLHEVSENYEPNFEDAVSFFGDYESVIREAFGKAVEHGTSYDLEIQLATAKHNNLWVRVIGTPEFKDGKCIRVSGTFQDITENYLHRIALNTAKIQAEEASVAKSEFLASMSHEIRTPLNGIIGFTDLVLKTVLNQTQQQYLTIVNQSANALLGVINDILDFSKIEAGKLELDIEKSDLFELTSEASDIITFQAQNKGLEVLLNIEPNLPRYVYIDSIRLKQVLINLLGNAIKFTDNGEIELKIYTESDLNKEYVDFCFEVRDTGIGIQPDKQIKIFDAFSQEDSSTTKKYGGTGLGLTISNRLLDLMDSKLELKSKVGFGSTFYFKIRLKAQHGEVQPSEDISFIKTALVVDDNENNRLILRQMLLIKNIKVTEAKNGLEALQLLSEGKRYDVILMDYHMPYMDGLETIAKIRKSFVQDSDYQPIMLLHSSSDDEKIIQICEEYGVNLRMVKPIKMQDLFNKLAKLNLKEPTTIDIVLEKPVVTDSYKILVVEDNLVNKLLARTVIARILPNAHILEANNGVEAIEQYKSNLPDLILMDLQMPVMNGYEATEKIRLIDKEHNRSTIIVALTAGNVKGEKERCLEIGMNDFVTKPFVEENLAILFSKWLIKNSSEEIEEPDLTHSETHFNMGKIKNFMGNDIDTIKLVLNLTIDEIKKTDIAFKQLISSPSLNLVTALGHKLFGTASSTGLEVLANLAREIEQLKEIDQEQLNELYASLHKEVNLVSKLVKKELEQLD